MKKYLLILALLVFQTPQVYACLGAYQFKIFPVGVVKDRIVAVDVKISRTSEAEGNHLLKLGRKESKEWTQMWILYSYLSIYDKNQTLISCTPLGMTYSIGDYYSDTLSHAFQRGLTRIKKEMEDIEYFKPEYLSFCNFQQTCDLLNIHTDTLSGKGYVRYEGKSYEMTIMKDSMYYGFGGDPYYRDHLETLFLNSIRVYKTSSLTLVVAHLATGHEISIGYITSDPKKAIQTEEREVILVKEYKPDFAFRNIIQSTYVEPLLHHGYGFDALIVK